MATNVNEVDPMGSMVRVTDEVDDQLDWWVTESGITEGLFTVQLRGRRNPLGNKADREELAQKLREINTEVLTVDTFGRAFTGTSQNDAGQVGRWLTDLDVLRAPRWGSKN
jgi:hypothetical protein